MNHLKIFIDLTRINKPIGFMLLFWPCSWGLAYTNIITEDINLFFYYLFLFFLGSVLMRSAGCIFNDIADKEFDKKVERTKGRPIASGRISVNLSFLYVFILCITAFFILIQFNLTTILLGMGSMFLAFSYPFMKRVTYWPQLFLGLTFNWGIIMAWASINNNISIEIFLLYLSAISWTLGYDTIYGGQDISDDEIIGLKSTSIKFKKNIKMFVAICYLTSVTLVSYLFQNDVGLNLFTVFLILFILSLIFQIRNFRLSNPISCLKSFKLNNLSGMLLFLAILTTSI